jgi:hypothetical protein
MSKSATSILTHLQQLISGAATTKPTAPGSCTNDTGMSDIEFAMEITAQTEKAAENPEAVNAQTILIIAELIRALGPRNFFTATSVAQLVIIGRAQREIPPGTSQEQVEALARCWTNTALETDRIAKKFRDI